MTHPALRTRLCELVGVEFPIVQTGMGYVAGASLAAATANAGGLGIIASATMDLGQLADAIARVKERTTRPFGVNLEALRVGAPFGEGLERALAAGADAAGVQSLFARWTANGLVVSVAT